MVIISIRCNHEYTVTLAVITPTHWQPEEPVSYHDGTQSLRRLRLTTASELEGAELWGTAILLLVSYTTRCQREKMRIDTVRTVRSYAGNPSGGTVLRTEGALMADAYDIIPMSITISPPCFRVTENGVLVPGKRRMK